ncbi:MAG TPA: hypothetical protein VFB32_14480 [Rudaea sp.]|nr:hypothetical protein [Rudaea sp.]
MTAILTDVPQVALWTDLVHEAENGAATRLDEELEAYLVFLLMGHTRDVQLHRDAVALDYLLARAESGTRHKQELREVGDRCLLLAGLYPEQAERRLVSVRYFLDLGSRAYGELAQALRAGIADLYGHLAEAFARLVRVLMEVRRKMRDVAPMLVHEIRTTAGAERDPLFAGAVLLAGNDTRQ